MKTPVHLLLLALLLLMGCKKEDTNSPLVYAIGFPSDNRLRSSDSLKMNLTIIDNEELLSWKWVVEDSLGSNDEFQNMALPWQHQEEFTLTGNTVFERIRAKIPDSIAAGYYKMIISANDMDGITGRLIIRFEMISRIDSIAPTISVDSFPDSAQVSQVQPVILKLTDNLALAQYRVLCTEKQSGSVISDSLFISQGILDSFSFDLTMPMDANSYNYSFTVRDRFNNFTTIKKSIVVH